MKVACGWVTRYHSFIIKIWLAIHAFKIDVDLADLFMTEKSPMASIQYEGGRRGPFLLVWFHVNHNMDK